MLRGLTTLVSRGRISRTPLVRHGHGFIKKNIYVEENAGLREISYKTFEFDQTSVSYILFLMIIPGLYVYQTSMTEMKLKDEHAGRPNRIYGTFLPDSSESAVMNVRGESPIQIKQVEEE